MNYLSASTGNAPVLSLYAGLINNNKHLGVEVVQEPGFAKAARGGSFSFAEAVKGVISQNAGALGNVRSKDTDSIQVAIRWSNANNPDIAHLTNTEPLGKPRPFGANWSLYPENIPAVQRSRALMGMAVPKGATDVNIVIVYTDIIFSNVLFGHGDVPIVIGSFSGHLYSGGYWGFAPNLQDLTPNNQKEPLMKTYPAILANTESVLWSRTGYILQSRPYGLTQGMNRDDARVIIAAAIGKTINSDSDTGYDIVLPPLIVPASMVPSWWAHLQGLPPQP